MTLTQLAQKHNIAPESAKAFLFDVFDSFPELNLNNYGHDDVCELNNWCIEQVLAARPTDLGE